MKITCNREALHEAFQVASLVAPKSSPVTVLQNVKIEVTSDHAHLLATDMEMAIRVQVEGIEVTSAGTVLVPVAQFGPILRESNDDQLTIETDGTGVVVRGNRSEFQLPATNPDEFPLIARFEGDRYQVIRCGLMKELIRRTLFATDTESARFALSGVKLEFEEKEVTAIGTDGRRLARMNGPALSHGEHHQNDFTTIVPARSMQLIERALGDSEQEIKLAASANDISIEMDGCFIYSRLVEGRFPPWRDVFPNRSDAVTIDLTVGPFFANLRQASIVASQDSRGIDFSFGEGTLTMSAVTAEVGQSRVEMPIPYDGEPITLTLDNRYVADFLRVLSNETNFHVEIKDAESAALFTTDDGYGYVIMPLAKDV